MAEEKEPSKGATREDAAKLKFNPTESKPIFSWSSPEFIRYKKSSKWYTYLVIVAIILVAIFIWQKSWSAAALVAVAAIVLGISSEAKPKNIKNAIYAEGVVTDGKAYSFNEFKGFWIGGTDIPKLYLDRTGRITGPVALPLLDQDLEQIRLFASKHLPEVEAKNEVIDSINTIFRL